ncbi:Iron-sulfur cluster-binding protein [Olavius algarvensis associated proteobacterium Delta 3]|nr:Iron-sulfur cluster-binding protein [Olavius algarvensis associated proteobacterium Delta 3]
MEKLSRIVQEVVRIEGACRAGISTVETLEGGPPSTDLTYVLPGATSAISFAVAIDQDVIPPYLMKTDRIAFENEIIRANAVASSIALHLANYLNQKGYPSVPVAANNVYRPPDSGNVPEYTADLYYPDMAHRYLSVRSGVGHMGLSGNVLSTRYGASIILGATVTSAELVPTPPLPLEENYCDQCRLCMASCVSGFMHSSKNTTVRLGGEAVEYAERRNYGRCDCVCSGYTGLHASGKWSTWSPGRFVIPERDGDIPSAYQHMQRAHGKWPPAPGGRYFYYMDEKLRVVCANCQIVCCPDKEERSARFKMLSESGVIIQNDDGSLTAVSPEEATRRFDLMPDAQKALYTGLEPGR